MQFTSVGDVDRLATVITAYAAEAIEVEARGLRVAPAMDVTLVAELQERPDADPSLAAAFGSLTPGRQREYNLHFADAKQASTRRARIDRFVDKIAAGKGMRA